MKPLFTRSSFLLMLVTLMLAKSSFALEMLIHESHAHESHDEWVEMDGRAGDSMTTESPAGDDCSCNEICCLSSVNLGSSASVAQMVDALGLRSDPMDHYQSVFLDPYLEPPTT